MLSHPRVLQGLIWSYPGFRVPNKDPGYKIHEVSIAIFEYASHRHASGRSKLPQALVQPRLPILTEEHIASHRLREKMCTGQAHHLQVSRELVHLIISRKYWMASEHLHDNASEAPHINTRCVWDGQHDLRSSVESGLYIIVDFLIGKT